MTDMQATIMQVVDRFGSPAAFETADIAFLVARQPGRDSNRKHSAYVLQELCALEALGLIRRKDDRTPILWVKA